nr:CHAT domain-containing protein [Kibdelosporangium phytohabitans]
MRRIQSRADRGDTDAMRALARALALVGRIDEALEWWWKAAQADPAILGEAIRYISREGVTGDFTAWLERAAVVSRTVAIEFARRLELGDSPGTWLERVEKTKHPDPYGVLCRRLLNAKQVGAAVSWFTRFLDEKRPVDTEEFVSQVVAYDLRNVDRDDTVIEALRTLAERGITSAARGLAEELAVRGDAEEAERWWEFAAARGDWHSLWGLVDLHSGQPGREADLERVLQLLAPRSPRASSLLRKWREDGGSLAEHVRWDPVAHAIGGLPRDLRQERTRVVRDVKAAPADLDTGIERPRYLLAGMPGSAPPEADISLVVQVSEEDRTPWGSIRARMPDLGLDADGADIVVSVQAEDGLIPTGDLEQRLHVPGDGPSAPIRFSFRTTRPGTFRVRIMAWAGGTFLAQLETRTEVTRQGGHDDNPTPAMAILETVHPVRGETALFVQRRADRFEFMLVSDMQPYGSAWSKTLAADPLVAVDRTVEMLKHMAEGGARRSAATAKRWVKETGVGLWRDLVPPEIHEQFWQIRDRIKSLTVVTDHDVLPWELLHPLRKGCDDGFLVEQFPVVRSVYGPELAHRIGLRPMTYVLPDRSPTDAEAEIQQIKQRLGAGATVRTVDALLGLIDSGTCGSLHFACHNSFSLDDDGSKIRMSDGDFRPKLLNSAVTAQTLAATSPLVFVNACRTAGTAPDYTRTTGWAQQFMAAGAGAFVGTLWPVRSSSALDFAKIFYDELASGASLGSAAHYARNVLTTSDADPTRLAYTVYGRPSAISAY